jgi:predicted transcriptional regulator
MKTTKKQRFEFRIEADLKRKLQEVAMEEKTTSAAIINDLIMKRIYKQGA